MLQIYRQMISLTGYIILLYRVRSISLQTVSCTRKKYNPKISAVIPGDIKTSCIDVLVQELKKNDG